MRRVEKDGPLRIGLLGSGFIANFHLQALLGVRDAQVSGVFSPTRAHREALANTANGMGLGPCKAYGSVEELVASEEVDAVWILGPNDTRLDHMRAISRAMRKEASCWASPARSRWRVTSPRLARCCGSRRRRVSTTATWKTRSSRRRSSGARM